MTSAAKTECPYCKKFVAIDADGRLARHGYAMGVEGSFRYGLGDSGCEGSNMLAVDAIKDHTDRLDREEQRLVEYREELAKCMERREELKRATMDKVELRRARNSIANRIQDLKSYIRATIKGLEKAGRTVAAA